MDRRWIALLAAVAAALVVALPALGAGKPAKETDLIAAMSGSQETPAGDPDGYGAADFRIKGNKVCFRIIASGIAPVAAAHIHKGAPGTAGDIEVELFSFRGKGQKIPPRITGCATTTTVIASAIAKKPGDYYVNVHNGDFPGGALRGQLSK
jgi:hypothetical protein